MKSRTQANLRLVDQRSAFLVYQEAGLGSTLAITTRLVCSGEVPALLEEWRESGFGPIHGSIRVLPVEPPAWLAEVLLAARRECCWPPQRLQPALDNECARLSAQHGLAWAYEALGQAVPHQRGLDELLTDSGQTRAV